MKILDVKNLSIRYDKEIILQDISFSIDKGQIIALIGPNGSGKTSLFKAINGLIDYEGSITWMNDKNLNEIVFFRENVVFQNDEIAFIDNVDVYEYLMYFALTKKRNFKEANDLTNDYLNFFWIQNTRNKKITQLSKGEKQRVSFASSLIVNPLIIFLDEPTNGVDLEGRKQFYDLICKMAADGRTIVISTHHLKEIENIINRAFLMYDSKLTELSMKEDDKKIYFLSVKKKYNIDFLEKFKEVNVIEYSDSYVVLEVKPDYNIDELLIKLNANGVKTTEFYRLATKLQENYLNSVSN